MDLIRLCSIEFNWIGNRGHTKFGVPFGSTAELNPRILGSI